jgi:(1->4)-alpha-D-glucan 1-alpha-D-glucosylmutase
MNKKAFLATYRLQLNKEFTFRGTIDIIPYLSALSISHIYLSPIFESSPGSMHGYDITDFSKISDERGGEEGFRSLVAEVRKCDKPLNLILDIVPNHMGIGGENPYWFDILSKGEQSEYWKLFDMRVEKGCKLNLPILEDAVDSAIKDKTVIYAVHDSYDAGLLVNDCFLPFRPETVKRLQDEARDAGIAFDVYLSSCPEDHLRNSLEEQHYQLTVWTESFDAIDYRRFFDITNLIGVKVEQEDIYHISHQCLIDLARRFPSIQGVRVDHIDGLADPTSYLHRLHKDFSAIWVEKILGPGETLPSDWPVCGTTGYEFMNFMNHLFVDSRNFKIIETYWASEIDGRWKTFEDCVAASKEEVLRTLFSSELKRLVDLSTVSGRDQKKAELFWSAMTIFMPVYRIYNGEGAFNPAGRKWVDRAVVKARQRFGQAFEDAEALFMPVLLSPETPREKKAVLEWQQLSGPVMAKGLEDTAHYRYTPLAALNEVGCEPVIESSGQQDYFSWLNAQQSHWPYSLVTTSTHDTKRSEDARHRLYALADRPDLWVKFFENAVSINAFAKKIGFPLTSATEYFLYQAIIGTWPLNHTIDDEYIERICAYMQKSVREMRVETNWLNPDQAYEAALEQFIRSILKHEPFLRHIRNFIDPVMKAGALNSLSVLTLKILSGAVPDIYQGMEMWNFSLVDPDNRRPVDFETLKNMQLCIKPCSRESLMDNWQDGRIKLWLTQTLLEIRQNHLLPLTGPLKITPLTVAGEDQDYVIAYHIGTGFLKEGLIVICSRFFWKRNFSRLSVSFPDLSGLEKIYDLLSGETLSGNQMNGALLERFPVGVFRM